jgi:hypothetical protein
LEWPNFWNKYVGFWVLFHTFFEHHLLMITCFCMGCMVMSMFRSILKTWISLLVTRKTFVPWRKIGQTRLIIMSLRLMVPHVK